MDGPPRYLYHGTSARARASIAEHGLDDRRARRRKYMQPRPEWGGERRPLGNYLYRHEFAARAFADKNVPAGSAIDVWVVDASDLELVRDPEPYGDSWYAAEPVPRERVLGIRWTNDAEICWREDRLEGGVFDPTSDCFRALEPEPAEAAIEPSPLEL